MLSTYLCSRKQYVQFQETCSDLLDIKHGVPQGSILGPLLFIIYINDFPNASNLFNFLMHADDTTLYCCLEDIKSNDKEKIIDDELQNINLWLQANKLTLNVNKTKFMLFYKPPKLVNTINISINNNNISSVTTFNFLGLNLNNNLTWNTHIEHVTKKCLAT